MANLRRIVKLLTGNYSAEYGARNGGHLNVTIKNGTASFHGSAYYYYRHEEFNANEYFNNQLGVAKPKYRHENPGGTIGGPVLVPFTAVRPYRTVGSHQSSQPSLFRFDSRWPFDGTDNLATFTDNITWIKGSHRLKAGFYFEHDARNVSVYSVYNTAGTYYFGSDLGNPVDTGQLPDCE